VTVGSPLEARLAELIAARATTLSDFLETEQERIARACHDMARAFHRGGTLVAWGSGPAATDAAHVAVEFMHPVIVGKRALPALAPSNDPTGTAVGTPPGPDDIVLALAHDATDEIARTVLAVAAQRGALTLAMTGPTPPAQVDYSFVVPSDDPKVVQEVQETTYHVLWELVHVFFEHPGLLSDACITCGDVAVKARVVALANGGAEVEREGVREQVAVDLVEDVQVGDTLLCHAGVALEKVAAEELSTPPPDGTTDFLYPFLEAEEHDLDAVLADVRASTLRKGKDVIALRDAIDVAAVATCAAAIRARLEAGGRLIAFGNGGSSTDAQDVAADFSASGWPGVALTNDVATVTAVGNDVGFDKVFARQLIALARPDDVALAISTSGSSPNVIAGLEEANRHGMLTCAISGYDGGRLAELDWLDHLFIARSDYIPRLQEAHATIYHLLLDAIGGRV
jgi:D-sedoheptulose 7-phosphate isomerase